jgi:hypothetical protein
METTTKKTKTNKFSPEVCFAKPFHREDKTKRSMTCLVAALGALAFASGAMAGHR